MKSNNMKILLLLVLGLFIIVPSCLATEISYFVYDSPGRSVTALVDNSQVTTNTYIYADFGNIASQNEGKANVCKYNGEQDEQETNLIFLRSRYYDPSIGRFITRDAFPTNTENPQSFNPYAYVNNNPVNFIDPLGLIYWSGVFNATLGMIGAGLETAAGFLALGVPEPFLTKVGGVAAIVHGSTSFGLNLNNFVYSWKEESTLPTTSIYAYGGYGATRAFGGSTEFATNVARGIDIGEGCLSFKGAINSLKNGGSLLSNGFSIFHSMTSVPNDTIDLTSSLVSSLRSSYGGVSLSKTAQLMLNINDVAGATYDENTGQIILFGKENLSLPQMDIDDLSVAVNSVFGGQDPGVSIGTESSQYPGWMKVRYDGATIDTQFGKVMFDADRLLKCLTMGYDNVTHQAVSSSVPGYENMIQRELYGADTSSGAQMAERMWFKPKEMKLTKNIIGDAMVFSEATMELLTEAKMQDEVVLNPEGEAFASHFTSHYDEFSNEFPVLKELKKLGKITSVVKWIRDNNIPLDLSFLADYTPIYVPTERYTQMVMAIFLMMTALLGMNRRKRERMEWVVA